MSGLLKKYARESMTLSLSGMDETIMTEKFAKPNDVNVMIYLDYDR
ncbi:MAG: hypothetical protein AAF372_02640 [Pseudomonadota bacterium]